LLTDPANGLPQPQEYVVEDYKPRLGLEAVGQPQIAVGGSRFGAAVAGGLSFYFSDLLGDQHVDTSIQFNSGLTGNFSAKDTAAAVTYVNQAHRWNWGVSASQIPYLSGGIQSGVGVIDGQQALIDQTIIHRQTERGVTGLLAYPFSRAHRVEFQGGVTQLSFDQIIRTQAYSFTGNLFFDETDETSLRDPLTLTTSSAALVYDTSSFGATSPVQGQRYRLEAAPTFGTIDYTGVLLDYRRYFMPVPFYTLATRVLHYGRYGLGGDDDRLVPLFLGYSSLVRGYDVNTFDATECFATATSSCPAFDRLLGSRILVGNVEFRFPLLRPFGVSSNMYGPVPVEVALFADGGVAWDRSTTPTFFGGERSGVSSVGATLRFNLLGFAIGQFDWARPLQRDARGWVFQFSLQPGF
jgi:outer membrane protein assembly factor BamA